MEASVAICSSKYSLNTTLSISMALLSSTPVVEARVSRVSLLNSLACLASRTPVATVMALPDGFSGFNGFSLSRKSSRVLQTGLTGKPTFLKKDWGPKPIRYEIKGKKFVVPSSLSIRASGASGSQTGGSIVVVGVSFYTAPLEIREKIAIPEAETVEAVGQICKFEQILEAAVLSTCNRVEIYVFALSCHHAINQVTQWMAKKGRIPLPELQRYVYTRTDGDAARHLFNVSAGIDSLILGEAQILAQVKHVLRECMSLEPFPPTLVSLFKHAITAGKRVRSRTNISVGAVSVSSAAVQLALTGFPKPLPSSVKFLVVGAGKMGRLIATHLAGKGCRKITVVNRSEEPVITLQQQLNQRENKKVEITYKPIAGILDAASDSDVVFTCTSSESPLFYKADVDKLPSVASCVAGNARLFFDISVPRNVNECVKKVNGVKVFYVDDLKELVEGNKDVRERESLKAREIVEEEAKKFWGRRESVQLVPTKKKLRAYGERIRVLELEKCVRRLGQGLEERERKMLEELSYGIVKRILSEPLRKLRFMGGEDDGQVRLFLATAHALERVFGLEAGFDETG